MTRPEQTEREMQLVRRYLAAAGVAPAPDALRPGVPPGEPDAMHRQADGSEQGIEVVEVRDEDVARNDRYLFVERPELTERLRARAASTGVHLRGLMASVSFERGLSRARRRALVDPIVDLVLDVATRCGRMPEAVDPSPLPTGVRFLTMKTIDTPIEPEINVSGATAFGVPLREAVEGKTGKAYDDVASVALLAVIPWDQRWPDGLVAGAIDRLRKYVEEAAPPFREIVVFDEVAGTVIYRWARQPREGA
jgi:hypothetical protein